MRRVRVVLLFVCLAAWGVPARASVSFTVLFDALITESSAVAVVTPVSASSVWEDGRIATYTKVHVDRAIAGSPSGDIWVRTLGGAVGDIGQQVEGEAVLTVGHPSLLFLTWYAGSYVVTARGQGQFAVVRDASGASRLQKNLHAGALLGPSPSALARIRVSTTNGLAVLPAGDVLDGKSIEDASREIVGAWARTHAH